MIQSAIYLSANLVSITLVSTTPNPGQVFFVSPDNEELLAWVAQGNVIQPQLPPPSKDVRADELFRDSDFDVVMAKIIFELINRVLVLEGKPVINAAQFKTYLKNKLN